MKSVNYGGNNTRIQVHTPDPHALATAITTFIPTPSLITEKDTKIVLDYDGKKRYERAKEAMTIIQTMIENGIIAYYDPNNPLYAYTATKHRVNGITQSLDYVNTSYPDGAPIPGVPGSEDGDYSYSSSSGSSGNSSGVKWNANYLNQLAEQSEAENQEKRKKIIIISIVAVAIVGFIVLAILKKKGKI